MTKDLRDSLESPWTPLGHQHCTKMMSFVQRRCSFVLPDFMSDVDDNLAYASHVNKLSDRGRPCDDLIFWYRCSVVDQWVTVDMCT